MEPKEERATQRPNTQWTAQYLVAAELARRNYVVAFTLGNMPSVDLIVTHLGSGAVFFVDVKGLTTKTSWLVEKEGKPTVAGLYYILVYAAEQRNDDHFFILTQAEARDLRDKHKQKQRARGVELQRQFSGFPFNDPHAFEGCWNHLPPNTYPPAASLST